MALDTSRHPCFDPNARHRFGRVHLPVAPRCNLGCNYCDRRSDCLNESRPGVSSVVLSPQQAVHYLDRVQKVLDTPVSVVGIAGPGDPFANPEETMETLRLVRRHFPEMLLCVATNGLGVGPFIDELADLQTSHVTLTINAVDAEIGARIYRFVRPERRVLRGIEGATELLHRQLSAIERLKSAGVMVKVNSIVMPGVNDHHIGAIAERVAAMGADVHNCMALYPLASTPFGELKEPSTEQMAAARAQSRPYLEQMEHCSRCRADAAGMLGEGNEDLIASVLAQSALAPLRPDEERLCIAVASYEGVLVNQHLGQAEQVWVYQRDADGSISSVGTRPTPLPGLGEDRWAELGRRLPDCRAIVCTAAGAKPRIALAAAGVKVVVAEGLIDDVLGEIYEGRTPLAPVRSGAGGCQSSGGCTGSGTGCG